MNSDSHRRSHEKGTALDHREQCLVLKPGNLTQLWSRQRNTVQLLKERRQDGGQNQQAKHGLAGERPEQRMKAVQTALRIHIQRPPVVQSRS